MLKPDQMDYQKSVFYRTPHRYILFFCAYKYPAICRRDKHFMEHDKHSFQGWVR